MREIILDGHEMTTKVAMHDYLKNQFNLPYYYGRNLDSLYQILAKETDPIKIVLKNKDSIAIGYGDALMLLFLDLTQKNKNYDFDVIS